MKAYFLSLSQPVSNSQLTAFRVLFGLVMAYESLLEIVSGEVKTLYIDIEHNFTFFGFEWLKILHGPGMYFYFYVLALCALLVAAGFLYRFSSSLLALMWTAIYLSHKTIYNNHYYLMMLLCWMMVFMPANRRLSADAKLGIAKPCNECYRWQIHLFIFQIACVYVFAGIAKINWDWLHAIPLKFWLPHKTGLRVIGRFMRNPLLPWLVAYGGMLFDLVVVPGLLYKPTRKYFMVLVVLFHILNGYIFRIGAFPYLAIALVIFFVPAQLIDKVIPPQRFPVLLPTWLTKKSDRVYVFFATAYAIVQLALPLRHRFIEGPVIWTEEGHRLSWSMMLRAKKGTSHFKIVDRQTGKTWTVSPPDVFNKYQINEIAVLPDVTLQAARYLQEKYKRQGLDVAIYSVNRVSSNFRPERLLIDTTCDLAHAKWNAWGHNKWILLYGDDR